MNYLIFIILLVQNGNSIVNYMSRMDSNQNVTFTKKEVDLMFLAATPEQLPILEKIFGKRNPILIS